MITIVVKSARTRPPSRTWLAHGAVLAGALIGCLALLGAAMCLGAPMLSPGHAISAMVNADNPLHRHVWNSRLPRALLGLLCGAALGLSGLLMQDAMRNRIAGPEILGVSTGSAVVLTALTVFAVPLPSTQLPLAALAGAALTGGLVLGLAHHTRDPARVLLIGATVTAVASGLVIAIVSLGTEGNVALLFRFLLGSLSDRGWRHVRIVAPWFAGAAIVAACLRRRVTALALGDDVATGLGIDVARTRFVALLCAAVLAAAVAAVCGPVAYIALLAPHLARRIANSSSSPLVFWLTPLVGAALLTAADLVSRTALAPLEIPVGITTTLIGAPALLIALNRQSDRP